MVLMLAVGGKSAPAQQITGVHRAKISQIRPIASIGPAISPALTRAPLSLALRPLAPAPVELIAAPAVSRDDLATQLEGKVRAISAEKDPARSLDEMFTGAKTMAGAAAVPTQSLPLADILKSAKLSKAGPGQNFLSSRFVPLVSQARRAQGPLSRKERFLRSRYGTALAVVSIVGGIIMIPTPGPGFVLIIFGLTILSRKYAWAHRCLQKLEHSAALAREKLKRLRRR
jgi:hypothetical protein